MAHTHEIPKDLLKVVIGFVNGRDVDARSIVLVKYKRPQAELLLRLKLEAGACFSRLF
ncbi:MAG: hypothetical protein GY822_22570 [Deltaproteobacteria bacterium]|nr:hypothetical protein [Deltaproteobacteria bacterium]